MKIAEAAKSLQALIITVIVVFCAGMFVLVPPWWQHNRGHWICVLEPILHGVWQDGGPGLDVHLRLLTRGKSGEPLFDSHLRLNFLLRYTEYGRCAPLDEERFWRLAEKTADEYNWPESYFMLALKYGYGGFVDGRLGKFYRPYIVDWGSTEEEMFRIRSDFGNGKNLDLSYSFALLKKSAEGRYSPAQEVLSAVYYTGYWGKADGLTVSVDYRESTKWLEKAAITFMDKGRYTSFYTGHRYRYAENYGLQPDYEKAYKYYMNAATETSQIFEAMLELALMYKDGVGVEPSAERAVMWLDRAQHRLERMSNAQDVCIQDWEYQNRIEKEMNWRYEKFNEVKQAINHLYHATLER